MALWVHVQQVTSGVCLARLRLRIVWAHLMLPLRELMRDMQLT
ncbi:MAG: hypothetical protein ACE5GO_09135 [Anaerolineales bacterium]